jgi:hypothetical protein
MAVCECGYSTLSSQKNSSIPLWGLHPETLSNASHLPKAPPLTTISIGIVSVVPHGGH